MLALNKGAERSRMALQSLKSIEEAYVRIWGTLSMAINYKRGFVLAGCADHAAIAAWSDNQAQHQICTRRRRLTMVSGISWATAGAYFPMVSLSLTTIPALIAVRDGDPAPITLANRNISFRTIRMQNQRSQKS